MDDQPSLIDRFLVALANPFTDRTIPWEIVGVTPN
jgi:hypothetical protein